MADTDEDKSRRDFLTSGLRGAALLGLGGVVGSLLGKKSAEGQEGAKKDGMVWQIDPAKCIFCGQCATHCVLDESAVKAVHAHDMCGYCDLCTGYFEPDPNELNTGAENQMCPTGAIKRTFIEEPYYEYTVDEPLCIGCAKCVKGCTMFGNASLFLQIRHDRCIDCNECSIAIACPADAFEKRPADDPYHLKGKQGSCGTHGHGSKEH